MGVKRRHGGHLHIQIKYLKKKEEEMIVLPMCTKIKTKNSSIIFLIIEMNFFIRFIENIIVK